MNGNGNTTAVARRENFGAVEASGYGNAIAVALAAQAEAAVKAKYFMAVQRPRSLEQVRAKLLEECRRPVFAESATYLLKWARTESGDPVTGPSIRFAEAMIRCWGNADVQVCVLVDNSEMRIFRVAVVDLESNISFPRDVIVMKTVERKKLREGQIPLSSRTNSNGETVYTVEAGETELAAKENALISKAIRTCALRLLPADIQDECMRQIQETVKKGIADNPDAARNRLADSFASIGIYPNDLAAYLGTDLAKVPPKKLHDLRILFQALRDQEITWNEVMERVEPGPVAEGEKPVSRSEAQKDLVADLTERLKATKAAREEQTAPVEAELVEPKPEPPKKAAPAKKPRKAPAPEPAPVDPQELSEEDRLTTYLEEVVDSLAHQETITSSQAAAFMARIHQAAKASDLDRLLTIEVELQSIAQE